jgi:hypothetical protein
MVTPARLLAAIAGTGALLGGVIFWARNRQRRITRQERAQRPQQRRM